MADEMSGVFVSIKCKQQTDTVAFRGTSSYLLLFYFVSLFVELSLVVCGCGVVQAAGFLVCAVYC